MKIKPSNIIISILVIYAILISVGYFTKPENKSPIDHQKIIDSNDSLKKVNKALEEIRTIDIHNAFKLRLSLDSLKQIRKKNIKHINNEISRLYTSTTDVQYSIVDSILRSRRHL